MRTSWRTLRADGHAMREAGLQAHVFRAALEARAMLGALLGG